MSYKMITKQIFHCYFFSTCNHMTMRVVWDIAMSFLINHMFGCNLKINEVKNKKEENN